MLQLFILLLTLFFTIPAHSMRIKPSQFQKRCYATMIPKDFNKLVSIQKNGYPLDPSTFISELNTMKKDTEDLKILRYRLECQMRGVYGRWDHIDWHNSEIYLPRSKAAMYIGLSILGISYIEGIQDMLVLQLSSGYFIGFGGYGICKWLPVKIENDRKNKIYSGYRKNLIHIESLLEHSKHESMLGKKYGE